MSYTTKYFAYVGDSSGNTFTINIKKKDYASTATTQITHYSFQPLSINYAGGRDSIDNVLHGSDVTFTFYCLESQNFDDLLDSEYRDFQLEILKNGDLYWMGWIQPEYLSKRFSVPAYYISLYATDGLADLKYIDYPSSGATGFKTYIEIIKECLAQTGFEIDIEDQVNISEQNVAEPIFENLLGNTKRFISVKDGLTRYLNCYDTLSRILEAFDVKLIQAGGKWRITQRGEIESNVHSYEWNSLSSTTTTGFTRIVDITNRFQIFDSDLLSRIPPFKKMEVRFMNRNLGDNLISNGSFATNITGWVNGSYPNNHYSMTWSNGRLNCINPPGLGSGPNTDKVFYSPSFNLEKIGTGATNTLRVQFDAELSLAFQAGSREYRPYGKIGLRRTDSGITYTNLLNLKYEEGLNNYSVDFTFDDDGVYSLEFWIEPDVGSTYDLIQCYFDNIEAFQIYEDGEATWDKFYLGTNTGTTAIKNTTRTLYFADGEQNNDVGTLKWSETGLTSSWSTYYTGVTQFQNGSFDGAGFTPWVQEDDGETWLYLGGLGDNVQAVGEYYSKYLFHEKWFKPGTYTIEISASNDNDISTGYVPNGYINLWSKNRNGDLTDHGAQYINAGSMANLTWTITLREDCYVGFRAHRAGPGSDFDMSVWNVEVTNFEAPDVNVNIQRLYLYNKLSQYSRFKNYLTISIKDCATVFFWHLLKIRSKLYVIVGYRYDVLNGIIDLELIEYVNNYVDMTFVQTTLSTVDGE